MLTVTRAKPPAATWEVVPVTKDNLKEVARWLRGHGFAATTRSNYIEYGTHEDPTFRYVAILQGVPRWVAVTGQHVRILTADQYRAWTTEGESTYPEMGKP